MKCIAKDRCDHESECNEYCTYKLLYDMAYSDIDMPMRYRTMRGLPKAVMNYSNKKLYISLYKNILPELEERVNQGYGYYFYSKASGTGKTSFACMMMNRYIAEHISEYSIQKSCFFFNVSTLLEDIKSSWNGGGEEEIQRKIDRAINCKFLIMDDIDSQYSTEWATAKLFSILDSRYQKGLFTIVTANVYNTDSPYSNLKCGQRIISRLKEMTEAVPFGEIDFRARKE